jgi:hypothetical protein
VNRFSRPVTEHWSTQGPARAAAPQVPERSVRYAYNRRGDVTGKTVARLDELGQVVPGTESLKLSFLWDAPGRLRKVLKAGASGTETAAEFRYDYANRRVSKEARSLLLPGSAPDVRLYAPDEAAFLCEFRPAAGGSLETLFPHLSAGRGRHFFRAPWPSLPQGRGPRRQGRRGDEDLRIHPERVQEGQLNLVQG